MGQELIQNPDGSARFTDDRSGNRSLHMAPNARNLTTLNFKIDQTSPGTVQGLGADTSVTLPGGAIPVELRFFGKNNSNQTSGTLTLGIDTTGTYFLNAANVANAPSGQGQQTPTTVTNLFLQLASVPNGTAHTITGFYAETATSTFGGPWFCAIDYYVPVPG